MTIQSVLEELIRSTFLQSEGTDPTDDYQEEITQATAKLKALMLECLPKEKEVGEMRYGGCNPDEDRGWNQALTDIKQRIEKL